MPFLKDKKKLEPNYVKLQKLAQRNGLRHTIFKINGSRYNGEWKDDTPEGLGALSTPSYKLYEGSWKNNYRHGYGVYALGEGKKKHILYYRGDWKKGHFYGYGERYYLDGSYYKGYWKYSKRHGFGEMWYNNGSFYHGDWANDMRHGQGMMVREDGNRYEGEWKKDMKHGRGIFLHLDSGQVQEGVWENDYCVFSTMRDIKFRQSSIEPTPYPIQAVKLYNHLLVIRKREEELLEKEESVTESVDNEEEI